MIRIGKRPMDDEAETRTGSAVTQPLREEHAELLPRVDALRSLGDVAGQGATDLRPLLEDALDFLGHHLLPHATAEGEVLYPEVARLLGGPEATATMQRDHEEVKRLTDELAALASIPSPRPCSARPVASR